MCEIAEMGAHVDAAGYAGFQATHTRWVTQEEYRCPIQATGVTLCTFRVVVASSEACFAAWNLGTMDLTGVKLRTRWNLRCCVNVAIGRAPSAQ